MHEFHFGPTLITIVVVFGAIQATAGFLVYVERKICAYMQNRIGPNRVGPYGLLQVLADGLKFILKEEFVPKTADKWIFLLAPCIAITTAMLSFAVVPFGATNNDPQAYQFVIAPGLDIGILFIFAISSLAVYAIILGGWASNNKYSLLGGLRSSAQIISYEIPLGLSILGVVLLTSSARGSLEPLPSALNLERMIWNQAENGILGWNIFFQPLAFLLFMTSAFAECNRLPFDLPESEQELVGGYHTEYNAFKLAMFLLGEYVHMVTSSFLMVILFFGGWHFPLIAGPDAHWIWKLGVIAGKVTFFILLYMLVRWTLPRFRFDQLMGLAWKVLIPLALANLIAVMFVVEFRISTWVLLPVSIGILVGAAAAAFALRSMNGPEPIRAKT